MIGRVYIVLDTTFSKKWKLMLLIERIVVGPLMSNAYLVFDNNSNEGVLIDAGDDSEKIMKIVEKNNVELKAIYTTHGHFDHVLAVGEVRDYFGCRFYMHREDLPILEKTSETCKRLLGRNCVNPPSPDGYVRDGDKLVIGEYEIRVVHTPGHTPGSVSYISHEAVFTGDTLFAGAVGRHDLFGGNLQQLLNSLNKLLSLPEDYSVYPGHGPSTTIGVEKIYNPFIGDRGIYRESMKI